MKYSLRYTGWCLELVTPFSWTVRSFNCCSAGLCCFSIFYCSYRWYWKINQGLKFGHIKDWQECTAIPWYAVTPGGQFFKSFFVFMGILPAISVFCHIVSSVSPCRKKRFVWRKIFYVIFLITMFFGGVNDSWCCHSIKISFHMVRSCGGASFRSGIECLEYDSGKNVLSVHSKILVQANPGFKMAN